MKLEFMIIQVKDLNICLNKDHIEHRGINFSITIQANNPTII